jgi:zinc transport system ATP-binding protein
MRIQHRSLNPERGNVRILGSAPDHLVERGRLGYGPQRPTIASEVPATVQEIVTSGRLSRRGWWRPLRREDREAVDHAIRSVGLEQLATRPVNTLSGGQQQRAFIARAFASEPDLLVLDEPVAGVDSESQRRFSDSLTHLIDEHAAGVLLVSHELSAVAGIVDRVIVLKRRVLFDGTPSELMREGVSLGIHRDDLPLWLEGLG